MSRDMLELAYPLPHKTVGYIARQSWCSIGKPVSLPLLQAVSLSSRFQERSFHGDLQGNALKQISDAAHKYPNARLLIDLTDERGGFYSGPDSQVATHNADVASSGIYTDLPDDWHHEPFGYLHYSLAFAQAAEALKGKLIELDLWSRTTVLGTFWAGKDIQGSPVHGQRRNAEQMNLLLREFYDFLESDAWNVLRFDDVTPIADANHKWGEAPFHYELGYYKVMANRLVSSISSD